MLPKAFEEDLRKVLPPEEYTSFVDALTQGAQPTSIRVNASKASPQELAGEGLALEGTVPWCPEGYYLSNRPQFTTDPLLHSGCYYVQEASSMFLTQVLRQYVDRPVTYLDLCAAPGGKTTAALSVLPQGSQVVCNEIDRKRARILAENIQKWGAPNVTVTSNSPVQWAGCKEVFDVILTDVPCSGEGMFRKDEGAITDWSPAKVAQCASLQHEIINDIWPCLKEGGLLIYSTCTFNVHEDEEMLQYLCDTLGATALSVHTEADWHIHPALQGSNPCYRFMPHYTQGEGLFMAVVRKGNVEDHRPGFRVKDAKGKGKNKPALTATEVKDLGQKASRWLLHPEDFVFKSLGDARLFAIPVLHEPLFKLLEQQGLYMLQSGIEMGSVKGRDFIPAHALAISTEVNPAAFAVVEVGKELALDYLRREAITLPQDTPSGYVLLTYKTHPIGFVKNLGNRCNNLYPQEWRIRFL